VKTGVFDKNIGETGNGETALKEEGVAKFERDKLSSFAAPSKKPKNLFQAFRNMRSNYPFLFISISFQ
jgi:hypothetical protein